MHALVWLQDITPADYAQVGGKAGRLAQVLQARFSVPPGFCLRSGAYLAHVAALGLDADLRTLTASAGQDARELSGRIRKAIRTRPLLKPVQRELLEGLGTLHRANPGPVAVRSSATAEDLPTASYAGQQASVLNVATDEDVVRAVLECWASLWSEEAVAYRAHLRYRDKLPSMAVLIQSMLFPDLAGVAFSMDPESPDRIVIEATHGVGQSVESGSPVVRYRSSRSDGKEILPTEREPEGTDCLRIMTPEHVAEVGRLSMALETQFGYPQDIEWAFAQDRLYVLQARPITTLETGFFNEQLPQDTTVWTAGFLNERFPEPVSPLGWTVVRELLEELALRDPLRFLGYRDADRLQLTRLYRGHPYVRMLVFQTMYKVFPDSLLPEDARQYFPGGDVSVRRKAVYPRSALDPRFLFSMLTHLALQSSVWSPWHNYRTWRRFEVGHSRQSQQLAAAAQSQESLDTDPLAIWRLIEQAQALSAALLAIHRWSLICADLTFSTLRRLLRWWAPSADPVQMATDLTTGLDNRSVQLNRALSSLAEKSGTERMAALVEFLDQYGHRSFSLDIYRPTFADDPGQIDRLVPRSGEAPSASCPQGDHVGSLVTRQVHQLLGSGPQGAAKRLVFDHILHLAKEYIPLREEQRLAWQSILAIQRRVFLCLGQKMSTEKALETSRDIFFLTKQEAGEWVIGDRHQFDLSSLAIRRAQEFSRLEQEHRTSHQAAYPPFLLGNRPLVLARPEGTTLIGVPISPGLGRGKVVVLRSASELDRVQAGDVLVTSSVDPGWTPVFSSLSALVLEHGGQLSHAAIVAREYGLPAVSSIPGVATLLRDGEDVLVDGRLGTVTRLHQSIASSQDGNTAGAENQHDG